jgi:ribosomal protein L11 methyltransferase
LQSTLVASGHGPAGFELLEEADWANRWRQHAARECFGERLWLLPRHDPQPTGASRVLRLDPGLAFGSGTHPTTRLCLDWLAGRELGGLDVLDFGCGSGILGLAALTLGCRSVLAVDHDPQALLATRDNAAYNALADGRLTVGTGELVDGRRFDVVLANILAGPLVDLAGKLRSALRPGGQLVLSGLLAEQVPEVAGAYPELDFGSPSFEQDDAGGCWACLVGTAPATESTGVTADRDGR